MITKNSALTAAHCVYPVLHVKVPKYAGAFVEIDLEKIFCGQGEIHRIIDIVSHSDFEPDTNSLEGDIAVVTVSQQ